MNDLDLDEVFGDDDNTHRDLIKRRSTSVGIKDNSRDIKYTYLMPLVFTVTLGSL